MILGELLGAPVVEGGTRVGRVADVRLLLDAEPDPDAPMPPARLYGVLVGPRRPASFLGYERSDVRRPWPLAPLLRWRQRGAFLVLWADIAELSAGGVLLRPGAARLSPRLPSRPHPETSPPVREERS